MGLKYCSNCKENSIATKAYRKKGNASKSVVEYCINKNPDCQYKRLIQTGDRHEQAGEAVREVAQGKPDSTAGSPEQLELFPGFCCVP